MKHENKNNMISFLIFVINLTGYLYFMNPSVAGGDAGELLSEACIRGTAHPPGYPLFTILSHLFIRYAPWHGSLPSYILKSAASRVNFLCCLLGSGSGAILYQLIFSYLYMDVEIPKFDLFYLINVFSAVVGSFCFSFSSLILEYHTAAEVFALNNLLVSLILYQTIRITRARTIVKVKRESILGAFYAGLSLSNQHTSLLYVAPLIVYVLLILWRRIEKEIVTMTMRLSFSFIMGLSPYVYLVISSWYPSAGSWGDMTSLHGFLRHVLRSEYGTFRLSPNQRFKNENSFNRWLAYFIHAKDQFTYIGVGLFTFGFASLLVKCRRNSKQSLVAFVMILVFVFYLSIWNGLFSNLPLSLPMAYEVHARFWMQPNLIYCFCIGVGSKSILSFVFDHVQKHKGTAVYTVIFIITSGLSHFISKDTSVGSDFKTKMILHDYANAILNTLPKNSLLLSHSDLNWNSIRYLQTCESVRRSDVTHVNFQLLPFPWFQRQIEAGLYPNVIFPDILPNVSTGRLDHGNAVLITRFLRANLATRNFSGGLYMEMQSIADTDIGTNGIYRGEFTLVPWGMVYRVLPAIMNPKADLPKWFLQSIKSTYLTRNQMKEYSKVKLRQGSWEYAAMCVFLDMHYQLGIHLLSFALYLAKFLKEEHSLIPRYAQTLKDASKLLDQVHRAVSKSHAIR